MLLSSNRHALWIKDKSGYTPLHYACTFKGGTDHLIQIFCGHLKLLNSQYNGPPSILFSIKSPLYLACNRNAPLHVISTLVSTAHDDLCCKWIAPETGGEPYWFRKNDLNTQVEFSPLKALLQHYDVNDALSLDRRLLREVFKTNALIHAQHNDQDTDLNNDFEMMRKVLILIEAGFRGYSGSMLHLVSSLRTPIPSLIEVAGTLLPEQALLRDSLGCIPLHHVLLHSCTSLAMIMAVLEIDSRACSIPTPDDCSYPLMLAIKQGLSWDNGVKELVARMPEVLEVADSGGLVPCMLAASMNADVTTMFELLRASPQLCAYLI
jgi:ankyrin repeat protein